MTPEQKYEIYWLFFAVKTLFLHAKGTYFAVNDDTYQVVLTQSNNLGHVSLLEWDGTEKKFVSIGHEAIAKTPLIALETLKLTLGIV